ncbi:MAG TPA: hypothetical protein EYQ74_11980 [Planctomycetes bacterium]|nr:hypothetical protein [Planctomycetota bacterium]
MDDLTKFRRPLTALISLFALLCVGTSSALGQQTFNSIPHERLVADLLARSGRAGVSPDTFSTEEYLDQGYIRIRLGLFELLLDRESARSLPDADNYKKVCDSVLVLQDRWLDWVEPSADAELIARMRDDIKELAKWLKRVRGSQIAKLVKSMEDWETDEASDLYLGLNARASVREIAARLAEAMGTGAYMGLDREDMPETIILAPRRLPFIEWVSLAGWVYPEMKAGFWQDGVAVWTQFYLDRYKVMSLEFGKGASNWSAGIAMNSRVSTGMEQQLTQLATNSLVDSYYGDRVPESFAGALSVNLVIDVFGECRTRADGDLRSRRTEAYERFVPGGLSEGGWLPAISADSWWRQESNYGADRFVGPLGSAQKNGYKDTRDRLRTFRLRNDADSHDEIVRAPFLGMAAADMPVPGSTFRGDYKELLRAYRTAFVYWLHSERAKDAEEVFSKLLVHLAGTKEDLEEAIASLYDVPLSSTELTNEDLEGQFLAWVLRQ